jgi:hypothetical protein
MTPDEVAAAVWAYNLGTETAGSRLASIAKTAGTAATLLALIGSGATAGAMLVNYSSLASGTAAQHLLVDPVVIPEATWSLQYGGGKLSKETAEDRTRLFREHWNYIDHLDRLRTIDIKVADDINGDTTVSIPLGMALPDSVAARTMRGNVGELDSPPIVADILGDPMALAMLAVLIVEATED